MKSHPTIFKKDSKGNLRIWFMEQEGAKYRTCSGLGNGKLAVSEWTTAVPKSQPTAEAQADFEIAAAYEHKLSREYHRTRETVDTPNFFKPMLAHTWAQGDIDFAKTRELYVQPKLDGIRCIATRQGLFSRQGKPIVSCPHIREALAEFFEDFPSAVLDGELYNHELHDDFNKIVSCVKKQKPTPADLALSRETVQYHIYDCPSVKDEFAARMEFVDSYVPGSRYVVAVATRRVTTQEQMDEFFARWVEEGYEGLMVRLNALYEQKRSKNLLKRKDFQDAEYEVVEITEGVGNWSGVAKSVTCRMPDGRTFGAGIRGTRERAKALLHEKHKLATVRFFCLTPDGIPRFPVVTKFHGTSGKM